MVAVWWQEDEGVDGWMWKESQEAVISDGGSGIALMAGDGRQWRREWTLIKALA